MTKECIHKHRQVRRLPGWVAPVTVLLWAFLLGFLAPLAIVARRHAALPTEAGLALAADVVPAALVVLALTQEETLNPKP